MDTRSIDLVFSKSAIYARAKYNSIDLYSGKDVNTGDLIAKIQIAGGISSALRIIDDFIVASKYP